MLLQIPKVQTSNPKSNSASGALQGHSHGRELDMATTRERRDRVVIELFSLLPMSRQMDSGERSLQEGDDRRRSYRRLPRTFDTWIQAFSIKACVLCERHPEQGSGLFLYIDEIRNAHKVYGGMAWWRKNSSGLWPPGRTRWGRPFPKRSGNLELPEGEEWDAAVIAAQPDLEEFCNFDTGKGCVLTIDEVFVSVKELQRCKDQKKVPWPIGGLVVVPTHETVVQGVGWTYYPIILNFNDFSIPPKCPESQRQWFKQSIQETIIEWTGAGSREKRDTLAALLGGVGTGLGVWNSADIIGLNSRINSLTDGMGHAMKTGGVADSLIVSRLTDNVDDIHTIANNLHLVEENIASIANSIKNEIVGTAIFCSMIGGKLLADLKETIKDIQENKWARQINATRIITSLKRKGVDITEDNLKYSYIEGPDQWMPHGLQSGTIGLILAIPRWEGQAEQLNFIHSIGTLSDGIYKQHFPSKRLATITGLEMDESCCRKSQHRWLCSCVWEKGAEEDGWVQLIKENLVQEVIRIGDIACFIGHSEYRTVDEICLVEEGSCIMVTTTIHVGTHTLFPSRNLTTEMINFTANADWTNLTMKLFPPIPKLTLELHELVKRTKQQLHPISLLPEQQKKEIEITTKNVEHPWWGILTNAETHPVLRTLSLVLMFIQVLTTIIIIYFCVAMKQMRKKLAKRIYNNEI
ncbi:uncharacterized protein O3C94_004663 [Discoglossus pictus]